MAKYEKLRMIAQSGRIARLYVQRDKHTHIYINIYVDPEDLDNSIGKVAERKAQGGQSLNKSCRERMSPLSRLVRGFHIKYDSSPLGGPMRVAQND